MMRGQRNKRIEGLETERIADCERGFTLIELLIAVGILVIIGSAAYTSFNAAVDVYQKYESRIVMTQRCRTGLDRITTDLSNMQAAQGDQSLVIMSQDNPGDTGDRDLISFVTLIHTDPDPFLAQLNPDAQTGSMSEDEENATPLVSDVQRVAYYIGPDPNQQEKGTGNRGAMLTTDETDENPVLLRIVTTSLNPETVIQPLIETGTLPTEDEDGNPIHVDIAPIINQIVSFDLKYFDGEEWYDSWESTDTIPKSVQILITVADENHNSQNRQNAKQNVITQSTMVYLPMSANFSSQPAGSGQQGTGGPGG